jgi:hypothetical protein
MNGVKRCLGVLVAALALTACAGAHPAAPGSAVAARSRGPAVRYVDTHGIEVAVPAQWPLGRGLCGTPKANTVLWNEDMTSLCLTNQPPGLSVVEFSGSLRHLRGYRRDTTPVTIDGVRARRWNAGTVSGSHEVQLDFPDRNLSVTVLSPDGSLLRRILASVRVIGRDLNGCPTHPTARYRVGSEPSAPRRFVPAGASRMIGCSYQGRWLDHSNLVGPRAARHLARALDAAPFGFSAAPGHILPSDCGSTWRGSSIVARFEYVGRPAVPVTAHLIGCTRLGASNGHWGVRPRPWWVGLLVDDARYAGALIDPHTLR